VQVCHYRQRKSPTSIRRSIYHLRVFEWLMIVKPIKNMVVFFFIKLHLNRF
jgi:hypothetical protein